MNGNKIKYVLDAFCNIYDFEDIEKYVTYSGSGEKVKKVIIRPGQNVEGCLSGKEIINFPNVLYRNWKNVSIPFIFNSGAESHLNIITGKPGSIIINFDVISASFYLLSGWHERLHPDPDKYGRFRYDSGIQFILGITHIPVVNYYFDILKTALEMLLAREIDFRRQISRPSAFMTHDVDLINTIWIEDIMWCMRNRKFGKIPRLVMRQLRNKNDSSLIKELRILETEKGVTSTFFFMTQKGSVKGIKCADYDIKSGSIRGLLMKLSESGAEIALHGSPGTESDYRRLMDECSRIDMSVSGNRFHFLLFNHDTTPGILEAAGIKYDSSLGFAENIGFRNSICSPFYLYDNKNDRPTEVLEIPLAVMDTTLDRKGYLGTGPGSFQTARLIIDEVKKYNGVFTLLLHNNYFSPYKHKGYREFYTEIIDYLNKEGFEFRTGNDICKLYS